MKSSRGEPNVRASRRRSSQALRWALPLVALLLAGQGAQAQDARAILQKTLSTYQALTSYEARSSVTTRIISGKATVNSVSNTVETKFKRPNKLRLAFAQPSGSILIVGDGANVFAYSSATSMYRRVPSGPTLLEMQPQLMRFGIEAPLDPFGFLCIKQLPKEIVSLTRKGDSTVNGRKTFLIVGVTRIPPRTVKAPNRKTVTLPATVHHWTWWVDKETYLLDQIEMRGPDRSMLVRVRQGKKIIPRTLVVHRQLRHTVAEVKTNSPLGDDVFTFKPPPGAIEGKSVEELLKSGKP